MAGTQHYGRPDYQLGDGAHHACGREFPTCNDGFLPFGDARLVDIHLTHRVFMYITAVLVLWLGIVAARRGMPRMTAWLHGILLRPAPRRRAERLARGVRGADHSPPRARHDPVDGVDLADDPALPRARARPAAPPAERRDMVTA